MIRFASLGSGSKGNATLIEAGISSKDTRLLLDCGYSVIQVEKRLARLERTPQDLSGIVVTHEHSDHISGVARLSRKYDLPVWLTVGTWNACRDIDFAETHFIDSHADLEIQDINVHPFPVPHDAREPCQFVFSDGAVRLAIATDLGCFTPHVLSHLNKVDGLLLECNYDYQMLMGGGYPQTLKARVSGNKGHLDNKQAAQLLKKMDLSRLKHMVGMHVSEKNNKPEFAINALCDGLGCEPDAVSLASQEDGFSWRELR